VRHIQVTSTPTTFLGDDKWDYNRDDADKEKRQIGGDDIPGVEPLDDTLHYLSLHAYEREIAASVKKEDELRIQPLELDDEAFLT
jgi:hypothetical protein